MKSTDRPREIFGQDSLTPDQIETFKVKLAHATSNTMRAQEKKALLIGPLNQTVKHYRKLADALAESLRCKTTIPLMEEFGASWEEEVAKLRILHAGEIA